MSIVDDSLMTFFIPTCNRYDKLKRCIYSIRKIYANAPIIIGDNGDSNKPTDFTNTSNNIKHLHLHNRSHDLLNAYEMGLQDVNTKYAFVVDDDD